MKVYFFFQDQIVVKEFLVWNFVRTFSILKQMENFNFIASNRFELNDFKDIETFVDFYPEFQTVILNDENELKSLLKLMGIEEFKDYKLIDSEFSKYWDLSAFKLPELNDEQFSQFYMDWIKISQRDSNMDEYGNLIFLQGLSLEWNKLDYRLIVKGK